MIKGIATLMNLIFMSVPKTNDANAEQTNSIVDDDVEQNEVSQNIIQG